MMAYGHTIKKRSSKKNRAATRQLEPRVVLASLAMAAGIFAYPFGVEAEIVGKEGVTGPSISQNGNVYTVRPENVSGEFAYSRFKEFSLTDGQIANLWFNQENGTSASILANLVNSRIDINGIVNGIKNGQIDGHLMFLSPDGIAVGPSGVINAGQFTGIVPIRSDFEKLYNTTNPVNDITMAAIDKLKAGSYATTDANGNAVGIDVQGQINTHSGVMLGAGIINIKDGAKIQSTKNLDFADLVNISGDNPVNAGLTLTAATGTGGDIILTAKQTSDVKDTKTENNAQVPNAIRWRDRSTDLSAAVNIGKNATEKGVAITSSDGAVKVSATSSSTYEDSTPMTLTQTLKGIVLGDENTLLDGVINKLANKEAANNKYLFVNYSSKKNKASVNVGQNSTITGKNIDIAANSTVEIKQSVVAAVGKKDSEGKPSDGSKAIAAVAVSRVYNNADVVIDGKLEATGADTTAEDGTKISALQIAANADTKAAVSATGNGGEGNVVAVGVAVLTGDTKAKVTVNNPASAEALKAEKGKVSVDATTKSDVDITVNAVGQKSYVVSNVGMANYDTNADVTINGSIKAGAVDLNAENTITGLKMTVDNIVQKPSQSGGDAGKDAPAASDAEKAQDENAANAEKDKPKSEDEKKSEGKSIDPTKVIKDTSVDPKTVDKTDGKTQDAAGSDGKGGIQDVVDKVKGSNDGGDNANNNSAFGLGTAVGAVLNENNAKVTLGKNAVITAVPVAESTTANGAVNVSAKTIMQSSAEKEDSLALSVKNAQANANVQIGAAVLVSNVKNNATVLMDNEGADSAQIKGDAVTLNASVDMGKYKVTQKKKDKNGNETQETEEVEKDSTLKYAVSAEGTAEQETPSTVTLDGSVGINTLKNNAIVLLGQNSKVEGSSVKLSSDATTNAEGTYGATDGNGKVAIGGTVGLQNIRGNSLVMTGKGAEIKGTDSFEASAENSMDLKNSVKNAGKGDSIGISGMLALSYGDSNSVVSLDDEAKITTGLATITSTNSTNIDNSAQSESTSVGKAFGIGVGIVNYDVNSLAMVSDNGSGIIAPSAGTTDKDKAAKKIYEDAKLAQDVAGTALAGKLGEKTANGAKGSITTGGLIGMALTTGMIQNDAKAKVAPEADEKEGDKKDSEKWTQWSKQGKEGAEDAKTTTKELEEDTLQSKNESAAPNASEAMGEASRAADPDGTTDESAAPTAAGSETSAGASIGIEGSAALTFLGGRTDAVLDNVTVKNGTEAEPSPVAAVSLSATDFLGSITLGGTSIKQEADGPQVGIGGTFAMNKSNRDVDSLIRNSELPMALMVSNSATKIGIEVAAGMGTSVGDGDGVTVSGAGGVYYNKANQDIHALMINSDVSGASVSNQATGTDFQIAGGLAATKGDGTGANVGVGGAVAISNLENNLSSGIIGGSYNVLSSVDVEAQKGTTQISGAVAGTKGGYGFEGAFAYGSTKNTTRAYISDNAHITALGDVNVKAGEVPVTKNSAQLQAEKDKIGNKIDSDINSSSKLTEDQKTNATNQLKKQSSDALDKEKKAQDDHKKTLDDLGLDTTGKSYLDTSENPESSVKEEFENNAIKTDGEKVADDAAKDEKDAKGDLGQNRSLTITAAMGGGYNDSVGVAAGIAYNYVKNDIAADIKGSTITADAVNGEAASDATIVSVGAGATIGGKTFNGAGSGSWNDLKNDTTVTFENNTITGKSVSEQASSSASIINIAGELVGGKGMAMGLSLAYNSMNNTTGTYLTNNRLTLQSENDAPGAVTLSAANTGKALAVASGVNVNITQSVVGATGTVAINRGVNHTESVIDNADNTISDVKKLSVTAEELTKKTTVAGGVSVGGKKVGLGGSVAYTSVGSANVKERLRAEVNHANITTTSDGTITVSTTDSKTVTKDNKTELEKSRITTVGAGFGVDWGKNFFNLQGGAAVSDIYKNSFAALNNTNINKNTDENPNNANNHPTINVTADTKSKINTVGVGGSVSIGSQVKGAAGVAINRMYQDTKAEMATDDGKTTTVNAGLTEVRATGDGDIHSVGVGGLVGVGGQVAFAGSGSYNYIGNNVNAILKNQNLTSNSSVGVVAQSDDRLYNFAGGFAIGANTKVGLGAAVGINKITGSTNALISGGSVAAADSGNIAVSRPDAEKVFKAEKLDVSTTRDGLSSSRTNENKTGIVVDSSATHTMISQLSSGGVAISGPVGVNVDGTVNLNTIEGGTTAKIQDAKLNTADTASNVNVNAIDYANLGTFTGTPSIGGGGVGVSVGVSANWETLNRRTEAEISSSASDKKNVYAKDLTVDATAKHGSSALSFAAAGSGGKVSVSSGDSIMRHKYTNQTLAKLSNVNAVFDGAAEVKADHLGNSHTENVAVSASVGMVAVAAGAGVSVMDDSSTVKAEVENSELKEKEKSTSDADKKTIKVLANNKNTWNHTLVTANLAVGIGAGVAANVGINNTTGETAALVTNSDLEATDVTVKATEELTGKGTGGVGAGGVGGVGVAVALNNLNSSVSAHVTGGSVKASNVKASNNIEVAAEEKRDFSNEVTGAAAGGIGVGVNVAVTSINKGITDAQLSSAKDENGDTGVNAETQSEISKHLSSVNGAKGSLGVSGVKPFGLSATDSDLAAAKNVQVSLATPTTNKQGVHTSVSSASLTADNDVNVKATDTSDVFARNVGVTAAGAGSVNVTDAIIHTNYDTDVTMDKATVTGKNVNVNALQTQKENGKGSEVKVTAVTVGLLGGVGVGYAGIVNKGAADVNISDSTVKATENVTVSALDESKHRSDILSVGVAALNVTTTFASVENKSNVGVTLGGTNNISATGNINIDAKKANALEAHTQGVGVGGVNVAVNHATIEDGGKDGDRVTGNVTAKITGTDGTFSAESFHLGAANDTTAKLSAGNTAVSVLGVSRMRGKGVMDMGADVSVEGGSFNAKTVEFASSLGNANGRTLEGNVKGHNISAVAVAPDAVILNTTVTSNINVANSTFSEDADLVLANQSYVDRKAYIYDVTAGAVAVGNSSADVYGKETMNTSLTGKSDITSKLASMEIVTYGENKGKAFADAGGGGLGGYIGAHVRNDSFNNVTSSLGGKWDIAGEAWLVAAQKDETRLTASEGHGGVVGVGGTSADNVIKTTTNATVQSGTEITADRTHIGTVNTAVTGAYDDKNEKGETDAQTYTLKDHFGGVISGNRLRSGVELTENGTVTIGENAKITTNKLQEYIAASDNNLTNLVQAKGGGAIAVTDAVSDFDINIHNKVDVGDGAVLSNEKAASTEDIILSAYDNQIMKSQVDGTVYAGVVSPIVTKNNIDMDRTSEVNVAGTIESGSNVGLYAGAKHDGALSNLNADLKSGAYNYSVISITTPQVNYKISADQGTVNVSGTVRSTRDINAIASGGKEEVIKDESLWNWAKGGSSTDKTFLTSDATTAEASLPKNSTVNVTGTGSLIAGTADPINLTIGGSVANGLTITAGNNQANDRVKNGVTQGTFDYANTLGARLTELNRLIAAYDGDKSKATQMAAYIAERTRIQKDMEELGLTEKDAQGNTVYINSGRPVYYVEIPDIATSGGNINVTANDFIGTGNLRANSAPSVTIKNQSDAYLKLNNILMGEKGGSINYGDTVIPPNTTEGNAKINDINVSTTGASFNEIYGVVNGEAGALQVLNTNTFSGGKTSTVELTDARKAQMKQEVGNDPALSDEDKAKLEKEIDQQTSFTYTAIPDVEVNGKLSNFYGQVEINNASGSIRISGGTQDRPTGVEGNTVKLIASNGSIAQDYKEGIVNINGDPEKYLEVPANALKRVINLEDKTQNTNTLYEETPISDFALPDRTQTATGYIAGRDVYVSAANVNVNGLIQSGYKKYAATVTEAQLAAAKARPAGSAAIVQNRTMYKVNKGGATWNGTDKVFDYVPQVYWDPSTDQLFVEDIDTAGGKVYLTGKIASTGDGKILAADGAADISVTNETNLDMNVGQVLNNQREGVITIADTAKNTWTEYKRGQTRTITNYQGYLTAHAENPDPYASATVTDNNGLSVGHDLNYATKEHQAYTWAKGTSVETNAKYQHYERRGFWGLVQTADESTLESWSQTSSPIEPAEQRKLGLPEGAVISQNSDKDLEGTLTRWRLNDLKAGHLYLDGDVTVLSDTISDRDHWVRRSGFLGWFKHIYDTWKRGTTTFVRYNYSMNASQPITIGLIGSEVGSINIKNANASGGNINLTGNVANSHNQATLNISSTAGGIFQNDNTLLKSEHVALIAKGDIKNIHIASIGSTLENGDVTDSIRLFAVSNGAGSIDVDAVGGLRNNRSLPGNVEVASLASHIGTAPSRSDSAIGSVSLSATGNITQQNNILGAVVEGRGINLTSKNGAIGTAAKPVEIRGSDLVYSTDRYGAQVNAAANGSIYLTEAEAGGDMRVGKIESTTGDVTLTVKGGAFIDGLPGENKSGSTDSVDEMVHRWIDAGLIDGEKDARGNYTYKGAYIEGLEKARDDYAANVTAAYDPENGGKTQTDWQKDYNAYKASYESYKTNKDKYAKYDSLPQEERETLDKENPGGYENYKVFSAQEAAYNSYLAKKSYHDGLPQAERETLEKNGDSDYKAYKYYSQLGYNTADEYLQKNTASYKYSQYADATAYLAADAKYQDLANKAKPENIKFEWTKDMMLYAVSDKLVNPESGGSAQTARAANVLGRNVTLTSTHGKVGNVSDTSTEITVEQLTGNDKITHMKALMNMDASDVKAVRDDNGKLTKFVITPNMPLGVKATGTLDVKAGGDVSVAGRTDKAGEHSAINVGSIDATKGSAAGDVRLYSAEGIYNAKTANDTNIKGKDLLLVGGKESTDRAANIGDADKPLTVALSGDLVEARADSNVFIKNMNNDDYLRLGAMFAKDTISLTSEKGFRMSDANSGIAESYINAGKTLNLFSNVNSGIVGDANDFIRVLNDRATVNVTAKNAYIRGMDNSNVTHGTLTLGTVTTQGEFVAKNDDGSIAVGREEEKDSNGTVKKEAVVANINVGGAATLAARDNLSMNGTVKAGTPGLALTASNGSVTQTAGSAIITGPVSTVSAKDVDLQGTGNQFNAIAVQSSKANTPIEGSVLIADSADKLGLSVQPVINGDISVTNNAAQGRIQTVTNLRADGNGTDSAKGDIKLSSDGSLQTDVELKAANDVKLTSTKGDVTINGDISTGHQAPASFADLVDGTSYNSLVIHAGGAITEAAGAKIDTPVVETYSGKGVSMESEKNTFAVFSADVEGESGAIDGSVKVKTSYATEHKTQFLAGVGADIHGDAEFSNLDPNGSLGILILNPDPAGSEIKVSGGNGAEGNLVLNASKDVALLGDANAAHDIVINSAEGSFKGIGQGMTAGNDITVSAGTGATYVGTTAKGMKAGSDIKVSAATGNIIIGAENEQGEKTLEAANNVTLETGNGIVYIYGKTSTKNGDITMTAGQENYTSGADSGNFVIGSDGALISGGGVALNGRNGDVTITENIQAGKGLKVNIEKQGNVNFDTNVAVKDYVDISTDKGDITVGKTISATEGKVTLQTGSGDISVGKDVTAGKDVTISSQQGGNIRIGDAETEDNGDVLAKTGNVFIQTDTGTIEIVKTVKAEQGSVGIASEQGNIIVGSNGPNVDSVKAKENIDISTTNGVITVYGKTSTESGDISLTAHGKTADGSSLIIDNDGIGHYGQLESGKSIHLDLGSGDLHVSDLIKAEKDLTAEIAGPGNISFDTDVNVKGSVQIKANEGNIEVGHEVQAANDITMTSNKGDIKVGAAVASGEDNVKFTATEGNILIGGNVTANDKVDIATGNGKIVVGDANTGAAGDVLSKTGNVSIRTDNGTVGIVKTVTAQDGSIGVSSGQGDILIGGAVSAKDAVDVATGNGIIAVGETVNATEGAVKLQTGNGDILVGEDITAGQEVAISSKQGNIVVGDTTTGNDGALLAKAGDVSIQTGKGSVAIVKTVTAQDGSIGVSSGQGDILIGGAVSAKDAVDVATGNGIIAVGETVNATEGAVKLQTGSGDILVGEDITAGKEVTISSRQEGNIVIGDIATGSAGNVLAKTGNVSIQMDKGTIGIVKTIAAQEGSIGISSGQGDILIGDNGPDVKTVTAKQNLDLTAEDGKIVVYGKTSTEVGDISLSAHRKAYVPGGDNRSFIIDQNGKLEAGGKLRLDVGEGDLHVSDRLQSKEDLVAEISGKGSVYFDTDVNVNGNMSIKTDEGDIHVGHEVQATKNIGMTTGTGNIDIGKAITSKGGSIGIQVGTGNVTIGDNGPDVETVTALDAVNVNVDLGKIYLNGKTSTKTGDIAMSAANSHYTPGVQNIVIGLNGQVDSGRDVNLQGKNGDLHVTDAIQVKRDLYGQVANGGGVYFDQSTTLPGDLVLSGNFIVAGSVNAKTNGTTFNFTATGAVPDKLITEDFYVGSLKSKYGTEMPSLWTNRGYLHVDEGDTAVDDALAVDKIYMDNEPTTLAIFGRTPTRDGEQLVYWNNLDMANDKTRSYQLYTDGTLRTHGTVLIDAERYYTKLYGDNLSVVDMMRDRVTHERGTYTFDSATLTEPGRQMKAPVFFGMESTDVIIRQQNAPDAQIVVEQ